jgi:hypothetical protein
MPQPLPEKLLAAEGCRWTSANVAVSYRPNLDERGCPLLDAEFYSGGAKNTHRVSDQYNCGMLRREHFVDLFRRRLYHLTFIVSHF